MWNGDFRRSPIAKISARRRTLCGARHQQHNGLIGAAASEALAGTCACLHSAWKYPVVHSMAALAFMTDIYSALASSVLGLHLLFILWVIFGALVARSRPLLRWVHITCLIWGILIEVLPWPCPLTLLENWLENRAGVEPYQGGFLLHYLDSLVYPNISPALLTVVGVAVCSLNLALYARVLPWGSNRSQ